MVTIKKKSVKKKITTKKKSKKKVSKKIKKKTTKTVKKKTKLTKKKTTKKIKKVTGKKTRKKLTVTKKVNAKKCIKKIQTINNKPVIPVEKKPPRKKNYLNNKDLFAVVVISKEAGRMSDKLARMLQMLCKKYASHPRFVNYSYNEDMQAYAMMMLVRTWNSFKPEKSQNPFAFYTQCIKNSYKQFLKLEKAQRNIRDKILVNQGLTPSHSYQEQEKEPPKETTKDKNSPNNDNKKLVEY